MSAVLRRAATRTRRATLSRHAGKAPPPAAEQVQKAEANYKIVDRAEELERKQALRPDYDHSKKPIEVTKQPNPHWQYGQGVPNHDHSLGHREVDPYADDRPMVNNYRFLISGIAPRPIGFVSTVSRDGQTKNLAPFSYFQVIDQEPPMFIVGFSSRPGRVKDTYCNLKESGECVINTVSEDMIEAVNATSLDPPYGVSEWQVSGLHEAPTTTVRPSRVQESIMSIEGKVVDIKEFSDHQKDGMSVAGVVLIKATRFWVREDATNDDASHVDLDKLRPIAQLGGMSYGRISSTFELPRKRWGDEQPKSKILSDIVAGKPPA
ncbi:hypothetical protein K4F52_003611 [Lecanicillium sp. MT-2017a]|nr:hypothetical protein K4F52_003611 [Lecanicillium sp. MT-2017a]